MLRSKIFVTNVKQNKHLLDGRFNGDYKPVSENYDYHLRYCLKFVFPSLCASQHSLLHLLKHWNTGQLSFPPYPGVQRFKWCFTPTKKSCIFLLHPIFNCWCFCPSGFSNGAFHYIFWTQGTRSHDQRTAGHVGHYCSLQQSSAEKQGGQLAASEIEVSKPKSYYVYLAPTLETMSSEVATGGFFFLSSLQLPKRISGIQRTCRSSWASI